MIQWYNTIQTLESKPKANNNDVVTPDSCFLVCVIQLDKINCEIYHSGFTLQTHYRSGGLLLGQDSDIGSTHSAFFAFISMVNTGHPLIEPNKGLLFHHIAPMATCPLDDAALLKIQSSLWNAWMDKIKTMADISVDLALAAIPVSLWNPDLARCLHFKD